MSFSWLIFIFVGTPTHAETICELYTDAQNITHVHSKWNSDAKTAHEMEEQAATTCIGYLHGRDRIFQMDFFRPTTRGKTAEWVGFSGIKTDFFMRMMNFEGRAKNIFNSMPEKTKNILRAYAAGVNKGMHSLTQLPYEYKGFGITQIEEWKPEDTIALLMLQSFDQTRKGFETDILEEREKENWGQEAQKLFSSEDVPWAVTVLKDGEYPARTISMNSTVVGESSEQGSNNWVVDGNHSESRHALFANDPHLALKHPPFWYWLHVESEFGKLNAIGATLAGVPGIVSGANMHLAWGLTNSYFSTADIVAIPKEKLGVLQEKRPVIWFRFLGVKLPFVFKTFELTPNDEPIIPLEAIKLEHWDQNLKPVMKWTGFELEGKDYAHFDDLMFAHSVPEADRAVAALKIPSWNFVYADTEGNIGYRVSGLLPRRIEPASFGIASKTLWNDKTQRLTADEAPHLLKPKRGWIVTANNRQWPKNSFFDGGRAYIESFRAFRIEELIQETLRHQQKHTIETFQKIQCDVQAVDARFLLPLLLKQLKAKQNVFQNWDFNVSKNCVPCTVYRAWMLKLLERTKLNEVAVYHQLSARIVDAKFIQDVNNGYNDATQELKSAFKGKFPTWAEVHRNHFEHLSGHFFEGESIPTRGDKFTVNPGSFEDRGNLDWEQVWGASQRLVVEMSSPPKIYAKIAGPNLDITPADATSAEWRRWENCEYDQREFPVNWSTKSLESVHI